jgi:hypothetical protein
MTLNLVATATFTGAGLAAGLPQRNKTLPPDWRLKIRQIGYELTNLDVVRSACAFVFLRKTS